jgi:glycosyltransferase involved in cell wall biosynthesis
MTLLKKFKITYIFPEPLPLISKARSIQVVKTVLALCESGQEVTLAYVPVSGLDPIEYYGLSKPPELTLLPLSRSLPGLLSKLPLLSGSFFAWRFIYWLGHCNELNSPDYIFVRHLKLANRLLAAKIAVPIIYEAHELFADTTSSSKKRTKLALIESHVLRNVTSVITITQRLADLLTERYSLSKRISVIPSATNLPDHIPHKDWSNARKHIIYAGSLYGWKGVDDLIKAAKYLPDAYRITIVGGDTEGIARLQLLSAEIKAEIVFTGHLPHIEVMPYLATACIAVLPNRAGSVSEFTSPLKLFEYMAYGCAVVASDLPVFREVLDEDDVAWFSPGDVQDLAKKIKQIAEQPLAAENAGNALKVRALQYSWSTRAKQILKLLRANI